MEKERYIEPVMSVTVFENEDIIVTSGESELPLDPNGIDAGS